MRLPVNGLAMFAPDCSSWGVPARGTSLRSAINVFGNVFLSWVNRSGCMVSRIPGCFYGGTGGGFEVNVAQAKPRD